eukprot:TRINITY_DN23772_c0_g2_i2.p1 TRINITY_DN23772_c0_g2~~TRINITY_DN23772_c0_g2_i2.p1  ORF type:complete len:345 (+),score=110.38 TRINITY_DN23772_c0_g2_i2:79-1035(+)
MAGALALRAPQVAAGLSARGQCRAAAVRSARWGPAAPAARRGGPALRRCAAAGELLRAVAAHPDLFCQEATRLGIWRETVLVAPECGEQELCDAILRRAIQGSSTAPAAAASPLSPALGCPLPFAMRAAQSLELVRSCAERLRARGAFRGGDLLVLLRALLLRGLDEEAVDEWERSADRPSEAAPAAALAMCRSRQMLRAVNLLEVVDLTSSWGPYGGACARELPAQGAAPPGEDQQSAELREMSAALQQWAAPAREAARLAAVLQRVARALDARRSAAATGAQMRFQERFKGTPTPSWRRRWAVVDATSPWLAARGQ